MQKILTVGFLFLLAAACSRKEASTKSTISIRAPAAANKVGAMSAIPVNRKACYGVSITGPGITNVPTSSCSPETGIVAGFVNPGALIEAEVPQGSNREIKLFVFLQQVGEDNPCPQMGGAFASSQLSQIYFVGSASDITLASEVQTVDIVASFPGESQNIAVTSSMPSSCTAGTPATNLRGFRVSSASQVATGAGIKMVGRIGRPEQAGLLTGAGIKLKVK